VLVADFDYRLPEELIAQEPLADRAASRMLAVYRSEQRWEDRHFRDIVGFVRPGDCLVLNNSKVFPSRLFGRRGGGSANIEVFLLRAVSLDQKTWHTLVRPGRKVPLGERILFSDNLSAEVLDRGPHGQRTIRFDTTADLFEAVEQLGHVPLPPYIRRPDRPEDRARYNTVFAREVGSVAAPTAGLHFTPELLDACRAAGSAVAQVTLHVGLGTFAPLHVERLEDVRLHSEWYSIDPATLATVRSAKRRIAVGTTSVRTLETAYVTGALTGETSLFISPGFRFQAVEAMLTNFHLPQSSLLMLVSAFAGRDLIMAAYNHAVRERYRFFSYGDCMLIL
jgi:S-adenosylmethionine:tRNA ribosyltransferase-isomerase